MSNFYTAIDLIGSDFLIRGVEGNKKVQYKNKTYQPTLFAVVNKETEYKTLDGHYVAPFKPGSVQDCRAFVDKYKEVDGLKLYGNTRYIHQFISDQYPDKEIDYDMSSIDIVTIDIEVASENGFPDAVQCQEEILAISIQEYHTKNIYTWGLGKFNNTNPKVSYVNCGSERELLLKFLDYWMQNFPDIITGWNCELYDIPYIYGRLKHHFGSDYQLLSPWKIVKKEKVFIKGKEQNHILIAGISIVDYLDLYKKFTYTSQESYRLDHIAEVELGLNKLDHSEYDTFKEFYTNNWQKFIEYNIYDVELVDKLEDKMKLIELINVLAYDAKVTIKDVYYQVRTWDAIIYNYLKSRNIVIPFSKQADKDEKYEGAYVKEPVPGKYDWVASFDLNSLYPHLIMQYNISPETLVEERNPDVNIAKMLDKSADLSNYPDYSICPNGSMYYKNKRGFLPELMEKIYNERTIYKAKMLEAEQKYENTKDKKYLKLISRYNNFQMARKIQLNSAYGAIGNEFFRYYRLENAEAITMSGQLSTKWIEKKLNAYLNNILSTDHDYVIASDTDSIYLHMGVLVNKLYEGKEIPCDLEVVKLLDKICEGKIQKYIDNSFQELADYTNAYAQKMFMKREAIARTGIWMAKKRYILHVWNNEGVQYESPKVKMKGIEPVKSSTPKPCRTMLKQAIEIILTSTEDELRKFVKKFKTSYMSLPVEDIALPKSASDIAKWSDTGPVIYKKAVPIHVRGALLYNHFIVKNKLDKKYSLIQNGEKIKYVYLKLPNPIKENVFAFIVQFPRELNIDQYVDRNLQFQKTFIDPLNMILSPLKWSIEKKSQLKFN